MGHPTHITILSIPGLGHLIPVLEFAKRIVAFDGYNVTLLAVHTPSQSKLLSSSITLPKGLEIVDIPPVDISEFVTDDTSVVTHVTIIMRESLALIQSFIDENHRKTVLVVDGFATIALDIVSDNLCAEKYMFVPFNAIVLAFCMYLPVLDGEVEGEFTDLLEPIRVPGCTPIQIDDLVEPVRNRKEDAYKWFVYNSSRFQLVSGIITNTCECLEPRSLKALRESPFLRGTPMPCVYPVGPLVKMDDPDPNPDPLPECIKWLDMQPDDSVLYVSFGSGGTLSVEQVTELAWGLELSQQRFIWVVRRPVESTSSGAFFNAGGEHNNPMDYLPDGFMTRTKGVGLVLPTWGPQREILAHKATGGFVSHCGWNSILESLVHGVVIIAWPLFAEQNMNARMLVEELGVAVRPQGVGVVGRKEIERVVRLVMEGKEESGLSLRGRAKEMGKCLWKAVDPKGGSSHSSMSQLLEEWKNKDL